GLTIIHGQVDLTSHGGVGNGAGIWNNRGTLTVSNSTISFNTIDNIDSPSSFGEGGGIGNDGGMLTVTDSTISFNTVFTANQFRPRPGAGGGLCNISGGTLTVINSTISSNVARDDIPSIGYTSGGGIYSTSNSLTVTNCTLSSNSAIGRNASGGAIDNSPLD